MLLDWLAIILGINTVTSDGAPVSNSPGTFVLNFIGAFVSYNATTKALDVTFPTTSSVPVPALSLTGNATEGVSLNTIFSVEAASLTFTYLGVPPDGVEMTFIDTDQLWSPSAPFTFVSQSGGTVRDPGNLAGSDGSSIALTLTGASVTIKWKASKSKWLAK